MVRSLFFLIEVYYGHVVSGTQENDLTCVYIADDRNTLSYHVSPYSYELSHDETSKNILCDFEICNTVL